MYTLIRLKDIYTLRWIRYPQGCGLSQRQFKDHVTILSLSKKSFIRLALQLHTKMELSTNPNLARKGAGFGGKDVLTQETWSLSDTL